MSDSNLVQGEEARNSALFAQLVIQQANMAIMLMGHGTEGQEKQIEKDLEAASFFIDQLEMIQTKTRGNLTKQESDLLAQSLTTLRMAFVEASEGSATAPTGNASSAEPAPPAPSNDTQTPAPARDAEDRVKFSKKY